MMFIKNHVRVVDFSMFSADDAFQHDERACMPVCAHMHTRTYARMHLLAAKCTIKYSSQWNLNVSAICSGLLLIPPEYIFF